MVKRNEKVNEIIRDAEMLIYWKLKIRVKLRAYMRSKIVENRKEKPSRKYNGSIPELPDTSKLGKVGTMKLISRALGVPYSDYTRKTRKSEIVEMRFMAMMFLYRNFHISLVQIGKLMGDIDHSTVRSGINRAEALLQIKDLKFTLKYIQVLEEWSKNSQEKAMNNQVNVVN